MRRIVLRVSYDGTEYAGWQRQPLLRTVQGEIERNLLRATGEDITLHASGRTDAGVHALGQVAHFDTSARMPAERFVYALNVGLERDIRLLESWEVSPDFHARFTAKRKHYRYTIRNAPIASALTGRFEHHVHRPLDFERMNEAAAHLLGTHDFAAFAASGSHVKTTVRTLYESRFSRAGELIYYDTIGSGYLYNMVRMMVGAFLDVGAHRAPPADLARMLHPPTCPAIRTTAPAHGLTLMRVEYE